MATGTKNGKSSTVNRIADMVPDKAETVQISAPNLRTVEFSIVGMSPLCLHRFSQKARRMMMETQAAGSQAKSKKKREPRNFDADYEGAKYLSSEGWCGIPAGSFRSAMIDACRLVGFRMTNARLAVFVVADGFDRDDNTPLVRIYGEPTKHEACVRNATGVADIRVRPLWTEWKIKLRVRFDADQFSLADVSNLLSRAGQQVGIGEGRHNSRASNGCGWGEFTIADQQEK